MCVSESHWRNRHKNLINRPCTQRQHLSNIKNNGVNEKDIKGLLVGMDWEPIDDVGRYAALNWLKDAAIEIQNQRDAAKKIQDKKDAAIEIQHQKFALALSQLQKVGQEIQLDENYKEVNRRSDKKRQEKYEDKHST